MVENISHSRVITDNAPFLLSLLTLFLAMIVTKTSYQNKLCLESDF